MRDEGECLLLSKVSKLQENSVSEWRHLKNLREITGDEEVKKGWKLSRGEKMEVPLDDGQVDHCSQAVQRLRLAVGPTAMHS